MLKLLKLPFKAAAVALHLESCLIDLCVPVSLSNSLVSPLEGWIQIMMDGSEVLMSTKLMQAHILVALASSNSL